MNKKIVGSLSLIPSPIQTQKPKEKEQILFNSCLLCKGMVHPEARNQGIFRHLLEYSIETATSEGYDILLGISNNPYSYSRMVKTGFIDVTSMRISTLFLFFNEVLEKYIRALKIPQILGKMLVSPFSRIYLLLVPHKKHNLKIKSGEVIKFVKEIENFHSSDQANQAISGISTIPFIRWRFSRPVTSDMCLTLWKENIMLAYIVIDRLEGGKNALIADLSIIDNDKSLLAILVSEAINHCKKSKISLLLSYTMEKDGIINRIFSWQNGFLTGPSKNKKMSRSRFLYFPLNEKLNFMILSDKNNWDLHSVDTCLFWIK